MDSDKQEEKEELEEKKEPEKKVKSLNEQLLAITSHYLTDLECLNEMVITVLPILKEKDEKRTKQVNEILLRLNDNFEDNSKNKKIDTSETVKEDTFKDIEIYSEDYDKLLSTIVKLHRAEQLFRNQSIVSFISRFDEFIGEFLKIVLLKNPDWLKTNEKKISYKELIELESIEKAIEGVIIKEIDNLLRSSHMEQIDYIDENLKLGIRKECSNLSHFYEATERRNLFVHTGGIISNSYISNCRKLDIEIDENITIGKYLKANDKYISDTFYSCFEIGLKISQSGYRRLFNDSLLEADEGLNDLAIKFLNNGDFTLAKIICEYDINLPKKFRSDDGELYYFAIINRAIALKFLNENFEDGLKEICWDAFHTKYKLCLHVLRDEFDKAKLLMKSQDVIDAIKKEGFRNWPIFREFRKSTQFKQTYNEIFNEEFILDPEENVVNMSLKTEV